MKHFQHGLFDNYFPIHLHLDLLICQTVFQQGNLDIYLIIQHFDVILYLNIVSGIGCNDSK